MRLFVAIELNEQARTALVREQLRVREAVAKGQDHTWTPPERMHLTLAFLGEVKEPHLAEVIRVAGSSIDAMPFTLGLGGLGVFPPRGAPRVIWVGTTQGSAEVVAVQRIVAERLRGVGIALERRRFHPHITLARWHSARPGGSAAIRAIDSRREIASVHVLHVTLFESRLSPRGATYSALAHAALSALLPPTVQ
jgi:2'-5' RNA ligase